MSYIKLDWKPNNEVLGAFIVGTDELKTIVPKGTHNGYVILGILHPYYGLDYEEINSKLIEKDLDPPHGGITFAKPIFSFQNQILRDNIDKLYPELGYINYFVIGFDTCHYGDNEFIWNQEAVEKETIRFAETMVKAV